MESEAVGVGVEEEGEAGAGLFLDLKRDLRPMMTCARGGWSSGGEMICGSRYSDQS